MNEHSHVITDREAYSIESAMGNLVDIGVGEMEIPVCTNDTVRSFLSHRNTLLDLLARAEEALGTNPEEDYIQRAIKRSSLQKEIQDHLEVVRGDEPCA